MNKIIYFVIYFLFQYYTCIASIKEDVAKSIVRIQSGSKYSTGFFFKTGKNIVTTLHSIGDPKNTSINIQGIGWRKVYVKRVYKNGDLVLLETVNFESNYFLNETYSMVPPTDLECFTVGYNAGNTAYQDRDFKIGFLQGSTLKDLLPSSAEKEIVDLTFPSLDTKIIYLKGNLLHGFSGSPILDYSGKLIGIASGGLENGASAISWCISVQYLSDLYMSTEIFPIINRIQLSTLFSTDERILDSNSSVGVNKFVFNKIKTKTFAELNETGNYLSYREMGLDQLLAMFTRAGIDFNSFYFDIYEESTTGAIIVFPINLNLQSNDTSIIAESDDKVFKYFIKMVITDDIQQASVDFEKDIMNQANQYKWYVDTRLSFLYPLYRPDGAIVNRKAFVSFDYLKYSLEVLAGKQNVFLGVCLIMDYPINPFNLEFYNFAEVAKYNLALQLTTFSY